MSASRGFRVIRRESFRIRGGQCRLDDLETGRQTRLIAIKVMHVPVNPLIRGAFWLDDVKLSLYAQRIDSRPIQMPPNRKLALVMGRFTADAVKSLQNSRCSPELVS